MSYYLSKCRNEKEWAAAKFLRDEYFFKPIGILDPYTWTFDHQNHAHFVLYEGEQIIGYAHVQLWPNHRAAIRIIVVDQNKRNVGSGSVLLKFLENWLKDLGIESVHAESRASSLQFYLNNGYERMPFEDPDGHESDPQDIPVGKRLC